MWLWIHEFQNRPGIGSQRDFLSLMHHSIASAPRHSSRVAWLAAAILLGAVIMLGAALGEFSTYPRHSPLEGQLARAEATSELLVGERSFGLEELWKMEELLAAFILHRSNAAERGRYSSKHE